MTIFATRKRMVGLLNKVSFLLTKVDPNWDMLLRYIYNHNKISISELFEHFYIWRTCRGLLWQSTQSNRGNCGWIFTKFSQNDLYTHWQLVLNYWVNPTTFRFSKTPYTADGYYSIPPNNRLAFLVNQLPKITSHRNFLHRVGAK